MSKLAIASIFGGICCLGLSIAPIPFQRWAIARQATGMGAIGFFTVGYFESERRKEQQRAMDLWTFQQEEKQKKLEAAIEPVLAEELIKKQEVRVKYSVADAEEEMKENFTILQVERYGENWLKAQLPQLEPSEPESEPQLESESESESEPEPESEPVSESFNAKKRKLLNLIREHEGGWIEQCLQKPLLLHGDMGSFKSYLASFLGLCRHYLRGHQIVSIADPHFHQNKDESWKCLVKMGVPGYGANQNYFAVGEQLNAMYLRFATRTLKDKPITSIWDEVTGYSSEEGTIEPGKKLILKVISDPRKANECPILIGHDNTLAALGGSEGFSKSRDRGIIQIELYSDSENRPLFKGTISGIKNAEGEFIEAQKVSIAPEWIRPEWVYELFNGRKSDSIPEVINEPQKPSIIIPELAVELAVESDVDKLDRALNQSVAWDYWLAESTPEELNRLIDLRRSQTDKSSDKSSGELSELDNLIQAKIIPEPLPREDYPLIWDASDFSRILPNESENALFEKILAYLDKSRSASKIISEGLGFSQSGLRPRSYSKVGKPCFKYLVRKYGSASLIAQFADYLDKD